MIKSSTTQDINANTLEDSSISAKNDTKDAKLSTKVDKKAWKTDLKLPFTNDFRKRWMNNPKIYEIDILISCSRRNTRGVACTLEGQVIKEVTAGKLGLKNNKKGQSVSAQMTLSELTSAMLMLGTKKIRRVLTAGTHKNNKDFALRALLGKIDVNGVEILDVTKKQFGGTRFKSPRCV